MGEAAEVEVAAGTVPEAAEELELVPLREAARRLEVSTDTVRRWLKRGKLRGEQRDTKQGPAWFVAVPALSPSSPERVAEPLSPAEREELARLQERVVGLERVLEVAQRESESVRGERDLWRQRALDGDEAQRQLRLLLAKALDAGDEEKAIAATAGERTPPAPEKKAAGLRGWWAERTAKRG